MSDAPGATEGGGPAADEAAGSGGVAADEAAGSGGVAADEAAGSGGSGLGPPPVRPSGPTPPSRLRRLWRWGRTPLILFLSSFLVFALFSWNRFLKQSTDPHFVLLANAFLKGTVEIRKGDVPADVPAPFPGHKTRHDNDWASWEELPLRDGSVLRGNFIEGSEFEAPHRFETLDRRLLTIRRAQIDAARSAERTRHYYVSFPPAPAVLMIPQVLISGYRANDVAFTVFFAAFNVALAFVLFRRLSRLGVTARRPWENVVFALALGFGSVHLWCSVLGQVWFTALVVGVTATLLYVLSCTDMRRPWLIGLALAFAAAVRPQLAFGAVLYAGLLLFPEGRLRRSGWRRAFTDAAWFALPLVVVGVLLAWYNQARFGNPLVFGHEYLQAGKIDRIRDWGLFNYHFLSYNLTAAFATLPKLSRNAPHVIFSLHGMSVFLSMPFLVYLFAPRHPDGDRATFLWHRVLWAATAAVAIPGFLYQNTGWEQYGFRFAMDWIVYVTVLVAMTRRRIAWFFGTLLVVGFLVNAWGAVAFKRGGWFERFFDTFLTP